MNSIGIDVSKEKSTVCILRPYGEVIMAPKDLYHTESDLNNLINMITELDGESRIILEATGAYHFPIVSKLSEAGLFVSVINPYVMKKYACAAVRWGKTDKLDSVRIANYGIDNWFKLQKYKIAAETYEELKILGRQYAHYISMKIESKLALTTLLDRVMPGIKALLTGKRSEEPTKDKLSDFVEKYWHYDNITKMTERKFCEDYCKWAKKKGYYANETKARKIYAMALAGIPTLSSNAPTTKLIVLESVRVLKEINQTLEIILTEMQKIARQFPEYDTVRNMPGVGEVLACKLIAEIGDVRRFHSGSALIAYAGIDAPPYQSGKFNGTQRKISKRGSSLLRKIGFETMRCLKTTKPEQDNAVYLYMLKKESEGKPKKVAKIAALNKFLRIYYARVKSVYNNSIFLDSEPEANQVTTEGGLPFTDTKKAVS